MKKYIKPEIFSTSIEPLQVISASDPSAHNEKGNGKQLTQKLWVSDDSNDGNYWQDTEE